MDAFNQLAGYFNPNTSNNNVNPLKSKAMHQSTKFQRKEQLRGEFNGDTGEQAWNGLEANTDYAIWLENKLLEYEERIGSLLSNIKIMADKLDD
jgi:hypothetical protein